MNNIEVNKLDMQTKDIVNENIQKISNLFPNCISEGKVNFEMLKQELSKDIIEDGKEKYQLTWVGKKESIINANTPCHKTLRPVKEKSVDFDNTKNIYIEGDNLEALKILQESYLNKVKCIYIDPPYNTGNDFIYNDKFVNENELEESGQIDEYNNKLISNFNSSGRYHSNWLSMIYSRIKLARNLLTKDGCIFISIDDNEYDNLKKVCDEIFGENNYVGTICWQKKTQPSFLSSRISSIKEYILFYIKNDFELETMGGYTDANKLIELINISNVISERVLKKENVLIENGKYTGVLNAGIYGNGELKIELLNTTEIENGKPKEDLYLKGRFKWTQDTINESLQEGDIYHIKNIKSLRPTIEKKNKKVGIKPILDLLSKKLNDEIPTNTDATNEIKKLFDGYAVMDFPKPSELIKYLIRAVTFYSKDAIVMDFFSGSATTAEAVLKLNSEDDGKRKYIMIQIPELISKESTGYNQGFRTICDIGQERIRRACNYIENIDEGFRVYKVDSSNMKDVYYSPTELQQSQLNMFESNIKEDRTAEDLLTQVILDLGLTLDLKIEEKKILNNNLYFVETNSLVACFDEKIDIDIIDEICKYSPLKIVFKESSFKTDSEKINTFERIKKLSNDTEISII